jgi:hypothetical protein
MGYLTLPQIFILKILTVVFAKMEHLQKLTWLIPAKVIQNAYIYIYEKYYGIPVFNLEDLLSLVLSSVSYLSLRG